MTSLQDLDRVICLPQVTADELVFRKWEGEPLQQSQYNFLEPSSDLPQIIPDLVVVPLLAFDSKVHRLGYGKGHYDRTLHELRQRHNLTTIGYACSFQEVAEIPREPHDEKLDYIVTEKALFKI